MLAGSFPALQVRRGEGAFHSSTLHIISSCHRRENGFPDDYLHSLTFSGTTLGILVWIPAEAGPGNEYLSVC